MEFKIITILIGLALVQTVFAQNQIESLSQDETVNSYLRKNSTALDLANPNFQFDEEFYANDLFFFGFIHGSEKPQILDLELLKTLSKNGVYNYAPEVDTSLAYFFNQYLLTGDEDFLNFACELYERRVRQDASIQFKNKWKKLYRFNQRQEEHQQISIIGLDQEYLRDLTLTHIAFIAPKEPTGKAIIDSLKFFKTLEINEPDILSGKPAIKAGKHLDYFFQTEKTSFYRRFVYEYKKDSMNVIKLFGENSADLKHLMNQPQTYNREEVIFNNFKKIGLPLIEKGEKIYSNYGYFHIQQEKINGAKPLAKLIKDSCKIKMISIVGMLTNSECLKDRKFKSGGPITIRETKFKKALYNGYRTSKTHDGDSLFEKVNGIKQLKKISGDNDSMLFKLDEEKSPLRNIMLYADFKRGGKNWKVENGTYTTDYFQYIILIKNSKSNIPWQEQIITTTEN